MSNMGPQISVDGRFSSFEKLPLELRQKIYNYLSKNDRRLMPGVQGATNALGLLRTNKTFVNSEQGSPAVKQFREQAAT